MYTGILTVVTFTPAFLARSQNLKTLSAGTYPSSSGSTTRVRGASRDRYVSVEIALMRSAWRSGLPPM